MKIRKWENHGGYREGAGRPAGYDRELLDSPADVRKPHSIYCSDLELDYLKALLPYVRAYQLLLAQESHADGWKGTKEEFEAAWEEARHLPTLDKILGDWHV
jgi:hypothetical protein